MALDCSAGALVAASKCYCLDRRTQAGILNYLLCQWANAGGIVYCGDPSSLIQITGAGIANANGWYVKVSDTYWNGPGYTVGPVHTIYWIEYRSGRWELWNAISPPFVPPDVLYWSSDAEFPCEWNVQLPAGVAPAPDGQYYAALPPAPPPAPDYFNIISDGLGGYWMLTVDTLGNLGTQSCPVPPPADIILIDGLGSCWKMVADVIGNRGTVSDPGPPTTAPFLMDSSGVFWQVAVDTLGNLGTVLV